MSTEDEELDFKITAINIANRIVLAAGSANGITVTIDEIITMAIAIYRAEDALITLCTEGPIASEELNPIFEALYTEVEDGLAS